VVAEKPPFRKKHTKILENPFFKERAKFWIFKIGFRRPELINV